MDFMQDHPKLATVIVAAVAVAVVLFLYFLSTRPPSISTSSSNQPIYAHGNSGPVEASPRYGTGPGSAATAVRDINFEELLAEDISGGQTMEAVVNVDIDGNGVQEAVVLLRGKGDSRPLDWRLYALRSGNVELLYDHANVAHGEIQVDGPRLVESEGVYSDGDASCCPSTIKKTFYVWKGDGLVVSRVESAPPGP